MARGADAVRRAQARQAETVRAAADLFRGGEPLTDDSRAALVALLDVLGDPARGSVGTHVWDRVSWLATVAMAPHREARPGVGKLPDGYSSHKKNESH